MYPSKRRGPRPGAEGRRIPNGAAAKLATKRGIRYENRSVKRHAFAPLTWSVSRLEQLLGQARNALCDLEHNEALTPDGLENVRTVERGLTRLYDELRLVAPPTPAHAQGVAQLTGGA